MQTKQMSFLAAAQEFFGRHSGHGLKAFMEECKALNPFDKTEIREGLIANGFNVRPLDEETVHSELPIPQAAAA